MGGYKNNRRMLFEFRAQELCESRGGRPGLPSLISLRFLWTLSNTSTDQVELCVTNLLLSEYQRKTVSFSETYGVTNYGSGWRKDVVNQCMEFGRSGEPVWPSGKVLGMVSGRQSLGAV